MYSFTTDDFEEINTLQKDIRQKLLTAISQCEDISKILTTPVMGVIK